MSIKVINEVFQPHAHDKPILFDFWGQQSQSPLVIFLHGFKGFKDWGPFNLLPKRFTNEGLAFAKFNFSHNGTSVENPTEFVDLEAFGRNTFSKELQDLEEFIDHLQKNTRFNSAFNPDKIFLIGHSRGGGLAILFAVDKKYVQKVVSWSGVDHFARSWDERRRNEWKEKGSIEVKNQRTGQIMPLYVELLEDYEANEGKYNIVTEASLLSKPLLIIHGDQDQTIPVEAAQKLHDACPSSIMEIIEGGDHVLGAKHPWESEDLPKDMERVVDNTIKFLKG